MASVEINFLRQRHKQLSVVQKTDRWYATILAYISVAVIVASVGLFALQFYLANSLDQIKQNEKKVASQITTLASVEQEYLTLAQKFTEIQTLAKGKGVAQQAIEYFSTVFANQKVTLIEVSRERDGTLIFTIAADNVFLLQQALAQLQTADVLTKYPTLALSDLSRERSGKYTTRVSVVLVVVTPTPAAKKPVSPLNKTQK